MVDIGGADTSKLAGAEGPARMQRLQAEMNYGQQRQQMMQQQQGAVTQSLGMLQQQQEAEKGRQLEAARSGLEFNPDTKKYEQSAPAKEQQTYQRQAQGAQFAAQREQQGVEAFQKQEQINQGQQHIDIQKQQIQSSAAHQKFDDQLKAVGMKVDVEKEQRLNEEQQFKQGEERLAAQDKSDMHFQGLMDKNADFQKDLFSGKQDAFAAAQSFIDDHAAQTGDKSAQSALNNIKSGRGSQQDYQRLSDMAKSARAGIALRSAASNGAFPPATDLSDPKIQEYLQHKDAFIRPRIEAQLDQEMQWINSLPPEQRQRAASQTLLYKMSQDERMRYINKQAAPGFMQFQEDRTASKSRAMNQGAQDGQPSRTPTKHGQSSQPAWSQPGFNPPSYGPKY